jgi:hypothetical protein
MNRLTCILRIASVFCALLCSARLVAQEPATASRGALSLARLKTAAEGYDLRTEGDHGQPLRLVIAPVLRFSDPVSSVPDGALFLWTSGERPEAAAAFWSNTAGRACVEFQSLSVHPLTAARLGQVEWKPRTPGLMLQSFRQAPMTEQTNAQRLVQMRAPLRSFTASVSDDKGGRQELRMLPQPVYRYHDDNNGIVDGAIFVFARSTNPELFVLLEAKLVESEPRWHYAPARMTGRDCELRLMDEVVWTAAGVGHERERERTYLQLNTKLPD